MSRLPDPVGRGNDWHRKVLFWALVVAVLVAACAVHYW